MTLKEYLESKQMWPIEFARQIGVAPSVITRILRGERKPALKTALKTALKIQECTRGRVKVTGFA